jgi:hypothetical protein
MSVAAILAARPVQIEWVVLMGPGYRSVPIGPVLALVVAGGSLAAAAALARRIGAS